MVWCDLMNWQNVTPIWRLCTISPLNVFVANIFILMMINGKPWNYMCSFLYSFWNQFAQTMDSPKSSSIIKILDESILSPLFHGIQTLLPSKPLQVSNEIVGKLPARFKCLKILPRRSSIRSISFSESFSSICAIYT